MYCVSRSYVVSGGIPQTYEYNGYYFGIYYNCPLDTVESYDVLPNKWFEMPRMVEPRSNHSLVAVKRKLLVIDKSCEVYDSISKRFALLPRLEALHKYSLLNAAFTSAMLVGNYVHVFGNYSTYIFRYDVNEHSWKIGTCQVTKSIRDFFCVKVPKF